MRANVMCPSRASSTSNATTSWKTRRRSSSASRPVAKFGCATLYYITCDEVIKDPESGEVVELRCSYDPETRGGSSPDGRKVKATLHWVSAEHAHTCDIKLYDYLFTRPNPNEVDNDGDEFTVNLNPNSLVVLRDCRLEPSLKSLAPGEQVQFERLGYFCADAKDSKPDAPAFHRIVPLRDSWAKIQQKGQQGKGQQGKGRQKKGQQKKGRQEKGQQGK